MRQVEDQYAIQSQRVRRGTTSSVESLHTFGHLLRLRKARLKRDEVVFHVAKVPSGRVTTEERRRKRFLHWFGRVLLRDDGGVGLAALTLEKITNVGVDAPLDRTTYRRVS